MYRQQSYLTSAVKHAKSLASHMAATYAEPEPSAAVYDWQASVVAAYREAQEQERPLAVALATRIYTLAGRAIAPESMFVDREAGLAVAAVDGMVFRMRRGQVTILRACQECGVGRVESQPLFTRADLGYALSAWEPRCAGCEEEDPANWLES